MELKLCQKKDKDKAHQRLSMVFGVDGKTINYLEQEAVYDAIVHRFNAHEAMREALEETSVALETTLKNLFEIENEDGTPNAEVRAHGVSAFQTARAALAKAKEGE